MQVRTGSGFRVPVRLITQADNREMASVAIGSVAVFIHKQGGGVTQKTLAGGDWTELSGANMPGVYDLFLSASDLDTPGWLKYRVTAPYAVPYLGLLEVVGGTAAEAVAAVGSSQSLLQADIADVSVDLAAAQTAIQADVAAAKTAVQSDVADVGADVMTVGAKLDRVLGLLHENSVVDLQVYDGDNLIGARLRVYDSKENAEAAGLVGLLHTYTIAATYAGGHLSQYRIVLEP